MCPRATPFMLRLALLCHLSFVGAVPLATNVQCLPYRTDEIFLDLSGATELHNNLGGVAGYYCEACKQRLVDGTSYCKSSAGSNNWITCPVGSTLEIESCECDNAPSQVPGCEGKNVQDQSSLGPNNNAIGQNQGQECVIASKFAEYALSS